MIYDPFIYCDLFFDYIWYIMQMIYKIFVFWPYTFYCPRLLHSHGSGSSLLACVPGAAACCTPTPTTVAAACLPARGGGGPTSQGRAVVVVLVRGGSGCPAMAVAATAVKARLLNPCTSEEG